MGGVKVVEGRIFQKHDIRDHAQFAGLFWWKWDETQKNRPHFHVDPLKDRGFTIDGKPASAVLKRWAEKGL